MAIDNVRTQVSDRDRRRRQHHHPLRPLRGRRERADPRAARHRARCTTTSCGRRRGTRVGLVVETGEAREVHHFCLLLGFGAGAINPYLAFDTIRDLCREGVLSGLTERKAVKNYVKAAGKGILKVMSKMGISTVASYTGAQIFEAVGLEKALVDEYFTGTASRIEGIDLDVIAREVAARHQHRVSRSARRARAPRAPGRRRVPVAARRRVPPLQPRHGVQAAALDAHGPLRRLQAVHEPRRRPGDARSRRCAACSS